MRVMQQGVMRHHATLHETEETSYDVALDVTPPFVNTVYRPIIVRMVSETTC